VTRIFTQPTTASKGRGAVHAGPASYALGAALILGALGALGGARLASGTPVPPPLAAAPAHGGQAHTGQQARTGQIKHIVVILEENRSFDNIFGQYPAADGVTTATVNLGGAQATIPLVREPYYLSHDVGHNVGDATAAIDHGKMDGFNGETFSNLFGDMAAYQQLAPADIPNLYAYARDYVLADRAFPSVAGPTFPTHLHIVAAQDGGVASNPQTTTNAWGCDAAAGAFVLRQVAPGRIVKTAPCFDFATLAGSLDEAHLPWAYYAAPPSDYGYIWSALDAIKPVRNSAEWATNVRDEGTFEADARAGHLPAFSWVTPRALASMHPPVPVCPGENWIVDKVNAVMAGPAWASTMVVVAWDDWGGYYDHVAPPPAPAGSYGLRVPLLVISPYAKRGVVSHTLYTFESVLKTAETLWALPPLTGADKSANSLLDTLDLTQAPLSPRPLRTRACPPALTLQSYHDVLDQQLQRVLLQELGQPLATVQALHKRYTLAEIARFKGRDAGAVLQDLQTIDGGWSIGKNVLQLVDPTQAKADHYLDHLALDQWFNHGRGPTIFPSPLVQPPKG